MNLFNFSKIGWKFIENGYGNESSLDSTDVETFKKDPIASLARELCQNSIDARSGSEAVKIEFKSFYMKTKDIPGIADLKNELIACRDSYEYNSKYYKKFEKMIADVEREDILCLRVSDFYTKGLEGVATNDRNKAFYYLTKGNGLTTKISSNSGGSKGIGKFASFVASNLQTVFYSTLNENNEKGYIGIAKLASRLLDKDTGMCTTGYGYFSRTEKVLPILDDLVLDKEFYRTSYGTDVYIIGFRAEENWKSSIITKILDSFMCAIQFGNLEVEVDGISINKESLKSIVYNNELINFSEQKNIIGQYILLNDEFVHKTEIDIAGHGNIKIYLKEFSRQEDSMATNKCVMIRYPYMKITDYKIPFAKPCSAMCIIEKNELNSILREVENPQHTDWEPNRITEEVEFRREIKRIIKQIKNSIQEFANDCLLSGNNEEVDIEHAGDYLADYDMGNGISASSYEELAEKPKVINTRKAPVRNNIGDNSENGDDSLEIAIGKHIEEGDDSSIPEDHNERSGGDIHEGKNIAGSTENGDDEILRSVSLSGIKAKTLILNKNCGKYLITFNSIYEEKDCELELYYLDDNGVKYKPEIISCLINNLPGKIEKGKIVNLELKNNVRYKIELNTNLRDIYACEVKIYANR